MIVLLLIELFFLFVPGLIGALVTLDLTLLAAPWWRFAVGLPYVSLLFFYGGFTLLGKGSATCALLGPALGVFAGALLAMGIVMASALIVVTGIIVWSVSITYVFVGTARRYATHAAVPFPEF